MHCFDEFEILPMDLKAACRFLWVSAPQNKAAVVSHQRRTIPGAIFLEEFEQSFARRPAVLGNGLLQRFRRRTLSVQRALVQYLDMLGASCSCIGSLCKANTSWQMDSEGEPLLAGFGGYRKKCLSGETVVDFDEINSTQLQLIDGS